MNQDLGAVLLRSAGPADAATIVAITQAAYRGNDEKTGGMYAYVFTETAEQLAADMAGQPWRILIAERAGQPVACVRISQTEPSRINLWRLAVLPEAQGAGLGKQIIAAVERWAAAWGRPNVTLAALEASPENRELYERLGYTAFGRKEMGSMPGNYYTLLTKPVARQPDRTAAIYETIAEDYQSRHEDGPWQREALDHFSRALPAPARLLEVGCGPGRDARMLRAAGYDVLALDRTWAMLRLAESSGAPRLQADSRA
ncbi:MAG TPA: bifunctional GNAT family N-acetyltransferase/class I SAM-dependent methyltransferase, partial [Herpetosiphonaceae bacterium]|nr:bifunctional GNAT family N-acetyltransferase/class I SAM-dependent methyltransferase [Herpetosiphonaceae bacterium]